MAAETLTPTRSRRILVVEDLPDSRESLQELLQVGVQRAEVDAAEDGMRALEMLTARPYALVLTDLSMPRASGMRLLREVKERRLPCAVVIVTGHGGVREAVEAMRLGASDFLTKPVDPQQLVMLVERLLREPGDTATSAEEESGDDVRLCEPTTGPNTHDGHATGS